ncbi:hypothetical protein J6590_105973 [Homalodisca vitripennis]|nr:hypothetical protein J6590_105973 [Homalodisca vitripennis]
MAKCRIPYLHLPSSRSHRPPIPGNLQSEVPSPHTTYWSALHDRNSRVLCVVDGEMPHSLPPLAQFTEPLDRQFRNGRAKFLRHTQPTGVLCTIHGAIRPPVPGTKMPAERSSFATHNLPECSARVFRNSRVLCVVDGEMPHSLPPLAQFTEPLDRQFPESACRVKFPRHTQPTGVLCTSIPQLARALRS